jgi:hypothetical protein
MANFYFPYNTIQLYPFQDTQAPLVLNLRQFVLNRILPMFTV